MYVASSASAAAADHLIISEVVVKTRDPGGHHTAVPSSRSSIRPVLPSPWTTSTSRTAPLLPRTFYYNITLLDPGTANPGGGFGGDFHARFPAGYSLAAGDTCVIAINGDTQYEAAYGRKPDFELFEEGSDPDDVPELLEAYPGSIGAGLGGSGNVPVLSGVAESLVLYTWDGSSDLVQDIDYIMWGDQHQRPHRQVRRDRWRRDLSAGHSGGLSAACGHGRAHLW